MSYNCSTFKVKEIKDFIIPVKSLYKHERDDWHPNRNDNDDGSVKFVVAEEGSFMSGIVEDDFLFVENINCSGEGSGSAMNIIFEPAFKESTGRLVASCVWEGGGSINRLTVDKGTVEWENIDI